MVGWCSIGTFNDPCMSENINGLKLTNYIINHIHWQFGFSYGAFLRWEIPKAMGFNTIGMELMLIILDTDQELDWPFSITVVILDGHV